MEKILTELFDKFNDEADLNLDVQDLVTTTTNSLKAIGVDDQDGFIEEHFTEMSDLLKKNFSFFDTSSEGAFQLFNNFVDEEVKRLEIDSNDQIMSSLPDKNNIYQHLYGKLQDNSEQIKLFKLIIFYDQLIYKFKKLLAKKIYDSDPSMLFVVKKI